MLEYVLASTPTPILVTLVVLVFPAGSHLELATTVPSSSSRTSVTSLVLPILTESMITFSWETLTSASVQATNAPVKRSYTALPNVMSQRPSL